MPLRIVSVCLRKRAKGFIYVSPPNGKCLSTSVQPARKENP